MPYAFWFPVILGFGILIGYAIRKYEDAPLRPELVREPKETVLSEKEDIDATVRFVTQMKDDTFDDIRLRVWKYKWPKDKKPLAITDKETERLAITGRTHNSTQRERIAMILAAPRKPEGKVLAGKHRASNRS